MNGMRSDTHDCTRVRGRWMDARRGRLTKPSCSDAEPSGSFRTIVAPGLRIVVEPDLQVRLANVGPPWT